MQSPLGNCFAAESFRELFHCRVLSVIVLLQSHLGNRFTAESSREPFGCKVISETVVLQSPFGNRCTAESSREPFHCRVFSGTVLLKRVLPGNRFSTGSCRKPFNLLQRPVGNRCYCRVLSTRFDVGSSREPLCCRVFSRTIFAAEFSPEPLFLQSPLGNRDCCRVPSGTVLMQSPLGNCFAAESFRELFHCRVLSVIAFNAF